MKAYIDKTRLDTFVIEVVMKMHVQNETRHLNRIID